MSTQKTITIQFDHDEYEQLQAEARRTGLQPDVLVRSYVHTALQKEQSTVEEREQEVLEARQALDRLAQLRADLPQIDALRIARESREDLERRSII